MFSYHTFVASIILVLATVLFGGAAPSNLPSYHRLNSDDEEVIDAAIMMLFSNYANSPRQKPLYKDRSKYTLKARDFARYVPVKGTRCFPRYTHSAFIEGKYCLTQVDVGPVIFERSTQRAENKEHCSFILSQKVKSAMNSATFRNCIDGKII